jgi:hypothetical protein
VHLAEGVHQTLESQNNVEWIARLNNPEHQERVKYLLVDGNLQGVVAEIFVSRNSGEWTGRLKNQVRLVLAKHPLVAVVVL